MRDSVHLVSIHVCDQCRVRSTKMEEMLDKRKMKLDPKVRFVRLVNLPTRQA